MARPVMRNAHGRWSLTQVATEAGVTQRTSRTLVSSGYLDLNRLDYKDVLTARVAAALLDATPPAGQSRTQSRDRTIARNFEAIRLARTVIDAPTSGRDVLLAVLPEDVRLVENPMQAFGVVGDMRDRPLLLLPVGEWAHLLREAVASEAATLSAS